MERVRVDFWNSGYAFHYTFFDSTRAVNVQCIVFDSEAKMFIRLLLQCRFNYNLRCVVQTRHALQII